jgi:tetrahydromethanopterin S-methyltransferase subunit B
MEELKDKILKLENEVEIQKLIIYEQEERIKKLEQLVDNIIIRLRGNYIW